MMISVLDRDQFMVTLGERSQVALNYFEQHLAGVTEITRMGVNHLARLALLDYPNTAHLRIYLNDTDNDEVWLNNFVSYILPIFN